VSPDQETLKQWVAALEAGILREDRAAIYKVLHEAVPDFSGATAA
jgi:hypothetical protein